jgi:hypothetical protein
MINEEKLFEDLNNGTSPFTDDIHYVAYLFAKHYRPFGLNLLAIRTKVEEWARRMDILIVLDINQTIVRVINGRLSSNPFEPIKITRRDINFVRDNIATVGRRKVLFALLVYGKFKHDEYGNFKLPMKTFAKWMGFANSSNLYTRHIPWLVANYFIENVTENFRNRGHQIEEGFFVVKMNYLLDKNDKTAVLMEISDNDIVGAFDKIDWSRHH